MQHDFWLVKPYYGLANQKLLHSDLQNIREKAKKMFLRMVGEYGPRTVPSLLTATVNINCV